MSSVVNILRLLALGCVCFFSLIVLGVSAHIIFVTTQAGVLFNFTAFAVAVAALTLLVFPPLLIISLIRKGASANFVGVEIAVLGVFWVFWLATAAYSADQLYLLPIACDFDYIVNGYVVSCHEPQAVHGLSWLNCLILSAYWPFLLIMAIIQQSRGNPVWTKPINEVNMFAPRVAVVPGGAYYPQQQQPLMYAQQPHMGYPPSVPGGNYAPVPTQGGYAQIPPPPPPPQQYAPVGSGYHQY